MNNIEAFEADINLPYNKFEMKTAELHLPDKFDWIVVNPPWLDASCLPGESIISLGIYDKDQVMIENSLNIASIYMSM